MRRIPVIAAAAVVTLGAAAAPALSASKTQKATSAQLAAMTAAVQSSPVAGMNSVPTSNYSVRNGVVYKGTQTWAKVSLVGTTNTFQGQTALLVRPAGGSAWTVVDVGSDQVGCKVAPVGVETALGLGGPGCGIGDGYMAPPATLQNPTLTGFQLINRFFNYLTPQNQSRLSAFLADGFIIRRSNNTAQNKTQYLANHPTYDNAGIRVDLAQYGAGLLSVSVVNWQTTVPDTYVPALYTFAWVQGKWQLLSFARFTASPTLPPPPTE